MLPFWGIVDVVVMVLTKAFNSKKRAVSQSSDIPAGYMAAVAAVGL